MEWISVEERLPEIPAGKYGVAILVATFDPVYEECNPGQGYSVYEAYYGSTRGRDGEKFGEYLGTDIEFDFMELQHDGNSSHWGPTGDPVLYWMPLPAPPSKRPCL